MIKPIYDFDIELRDVHLNTGEKIEGRKAVYRPDIDKTLGIVSKNYQIVPHKDVIETFDKCPTLYRRKATTCKEGAVLFADYDIGTNGDIKKEDVNVGDTISFGLRVFNSYNLYSGVGYEIVGNRLVCKNGMVLPKTLSRLSWRHFENVDVDKFRELITFNMGNIDKTVEIWKTWSKTKAKENRIRAFTDNAIKGGCLGQKVGAELTEKAVVENKKMGVWGVYNVFTAYVTHDLKVRNEENRLLSVREKEANLLGRFYDYAWK